MEVLKMSSAKAYWWQRIIHQLREHGLLRDRVPEDPSNRRQGRGHLWEGSRDCRAVPVVSDLAPHPPGALSLRFLHNRVGWAWNHCDLFFFICCYNLRSFFSRPLLRLQLDRLFLIYLKFVIQVSLLGWWKEGSARLVQKMIEQRGSPISGPLLWNGHVSTVTED